MGEDDDFVPGRVQGEKSNAFKPHYNRIKNHVTLFTNLDELVQEAFRLLSSSHRSEQQVGGVIEAERGFPSRGVHGKPMQEVDERSVGRQTAATSNSCLIQCKLTLDAY